MAEAVTAFASYLLFKEIIADPLGHLYRAGEYDSDGVKRAAWLRVFDRPMVPAADLISGFERTPADCGRGSIDQPRHRSRLRGGRRAAGNRERLHFVAAPQPGF